MMKKAPAWIQALRLGSLLTVVTVVACSEQDASIRSRSPSEATSSSSREESESVDGSAVDGGIESGTNEASVPVPNGTRDYRLWPFSSTSPWNMPIGSGATYASVSGITGASLSGGVNYLGVWSTSIALATSNDPLVTMHFNQGTWPFLSGGGKVCGNSSADEANLLSGSTTTLPFSKNPYSTTPIGPFHDGNDHYSSTFHLPVGVCASADTDAHLAVFQPDGWVMESYNAIRLSNGDIVSEIATYTDARGEGTGYANGRKASMFPNFAGLIRKGEISNGRIPHALVASFPPAILTRAVVWPANAYDTNDGYSGTLPMGSLLAIPANVDVSTLGLTQRGVIVARAAQDFGVYVGDRGGGGVGLQSEIGNPDHDWQGRDDDITKIVRRLMRVSNNTETQPGGPGTRRTSLAPPL